MYFFVLFCFCFEDNGKQDILVTYALTLNMMNIIQHNNALFKLCRTCAYSRKKKEQSNSDTIILPEVQLSLVRPSVLQYLVLLCFLCLPVKDNNKQNSKMILPV